MTDASSRRLRRWAGVAALLSAALAAYVSLVPFTFVRPPTDWIDAFRGSLEWGLGSRGNFVANILLFVPVGLAGNALITGANKGWLIRTLAGLSVVVLAGGLSVALEMLQMLVPGRTPSLADVSAQLIGAALGAGAWVLFAGEIVRGLEIGTSSDRARFIPRLLGAYVAVRVLILLLPLDVSVDLGMLAHKYREGRILLNPLASPIFDRVLMPSLLLLLFLSVPVGLFATLVGVRRGSSRSLLASLALSTTILGLAEVAQVFIVSTRADVGQFLVNATGGAIGVLLARRAFPAGHAETRPAMPALLPAVSAACALVFYLAYHWSPFDFELSASLSRQRISWLFRVPFEGYYQNPEFKALADLLIKVVVSMPIGVTLRWWTSRATHYPRIAAAAALSGAAVFVVVIEVGQVVLPSRYPDDTDVLLAFVGIGIGWFLRRMAGLHRA